jgi:hypothetical protein
VLFCENSQQFLKQSKMLLIETTGHVSIKKKKETTGQMIRSELKITYF